MPTPFQVALLTAVENSNLPNSCGPTGGVWDDRTAVEPSSSRQIDYDTDDYIISPSSTSSSVTDELGSVGDDRTAVEPSSPRQIDSDTDGYTISPSSTSSSVTDELGSVDDDDSDRSLLSLREYLEAREQSTPNNGICTIDPCLKAADDNNPHRPYHATTPPPRPQRPNAKTNLKPLDVGGEPSSPCESCSSAHADTIPTVKQSPVRVPITPTSPTVDAEEEKTDSKREKSRDRKCRGGALSMPNLQQIPRMRRQMLSSRFRPYYVREPAGGGFRVLGFNKTSAGAQSVNQGPCTANERALTTTAEPEPLIFPPPTTSTLPIPYYDTRALNSVRNADTNNESCSSS